MENTILAFAELTREEIHKGLDPRSDEVFFHFPSRLSQLFHQTPHGIRLSNLIRTAPEKAVNYIDDTLEGRKSTRFAQSSVGLKNKLAPLYSWCKLLDVVVEWAQSLPQISTIVYRTETFVSSLLDAIIKVTGFVIDRVEGLQASPWNTEVCMSYHILSSCFGFINAFFTTKACKKPMDILVTRLSQKEKGLEFLSSLFDCIYFYYQEYTNPRDANKKQTKLNRKLKKGNEYSQDEDVRDEENDDDEGSSSSLSSKEENSRLTGNPNQRTDILLQATVLFDTLYHLCNPLTITIIFDHPTFMNGALLQLYLEFLKIRPINAVLDSSLLRSIFSTLDCEEPCSLDMISASDIKEYCLKILDILLLRFSGYVSSWEWDERSTSVCSLIDMFSNDSNFKSYVISNGFLTTIQFLTVDTDIFEDFLEKSTDTSIYIFRLLGNLHCHNPNFSNSEEDVMIWKTLDCIDGRNGVIMSKESIENLISNLRLLVKSPKIANRKNIAYSDIELVQQYLDKLFDQLVIMGVIQLDGSRPDRETEIEPAEQSPTPSKKVRF